VNLTVISLSVLLDFDILARYKKNRMDGYHLISPPIARSITACYKPLVVVVI